MIVKLIFYRNNHTVSESLTYAARVNAISNELCSMLMQLVMLRHQNTNSRMAKEIYDVAKAYKVGVYRFSDDTEEMIADIVRGYN